MTMMMTSSQFGLDDMEALLYGPSSPMADPMGPLLLHPEQEEQRPGGGASASPALSLSSSLTSSSSSPPPFYSPSPSPPTPLLHGDKAGPESDMLSFAWLAHPDQLGRSQAGTDDNGKEAAFCDLDWMTERMDLSEFDLDTLIGPCSPHEDCPSSPEDLLDSLDCSMDLDCLPLPALAAATPADLATPSVPSPQTPSIETPACLSVLSTVDSVSLMDGQEDSSPSLCVPEPQEELEIKSEPVSPAPSPSTSPSPAHSPPSPTYTLDLGSEVDVSECEVKPVVATIVPQVPRIVLSLSPTRIVLVLAPKSETGISTPTTTTTVTTAPKVVYSSPPAPVSTRSHRSRPYPDPKSRLSPPSPSTSSNVRVKCPRGAETAAAATATREERVASRPVKEKKLKKMEQNKTAATRYRQKKRAEHEMLSIEYAELEKKNIELTEKAESMAREIQYLKELMDEVRQTRIKKGLCADL